MGRIGEMWSRHGMRVVISLDGLISLIFGLATAIWQFEIFSTAVNLGEAGADGSRESLIEATLTTLSGYYVLAGAAALLLAGSPRPFVTRLALLLTAHHLFMAWKGWAEAQAEWVTGNPWYDVAIHMGFSAAYTVLLLTRGGRPHGASAAVK